LGRKPKAGGVIPFSERMQGDLWSDDWRREHVLPLSQDEGDY